MDTIQITTGEKRIAINGDENRVIVFNPSDVLFAERFYKVIGEFEKAYPEYLKRAEAFDGNTDSNFDELLTLTREICEFTNAHIDRVFGEGTSQIVFNGAMDLGDPNEGRKSMYDQFFDGIMPYFQKARAEKIQKYTNRKPNKKSRRHNGI